jgi:hypothetical protein
MYTALRDGSETFEGVAAWSGFVASLNAGDGADRVFAISSPATSSTSSISQTLDGLLSKARRQQIVVCIAISSGCRSRSRW